MTDEVKNQIIGQFGSIIPTILLFLLVAVVLGIGYRMLMKKISKIGKKSENEEKSESEKK